MKSPQPKKQAAQSTKQAKPTSQQAPEQVSAKERATLLKALQVTQAQGPIVEMGCFQGDTSVLLAKFGRPLYLYDSFAGLPPKTTEDTSSAGQNFRAGELYASKKQLLERFHKAHLPRPFVKKAWFADLTPQDLPDQIAFAFLDGDFYDSIATSLALVTPKIAPRGVIVVHDYQNIELPGVAKAVNQFLAQNPNWHLQVRADLAILQK
ncbi:MAG: TylF/MycF family methyltransferase [Candidatus Nomurabacteria bacterium]|jgi:O-methyltransferase|nr:TylF/MycF family methyltransferase [Candidatus Nomurabacteria bacterium]